MPNRVPFWFLVAVAFIALIAIGCGGAASTQQITQNVGPTPTPIPPTPTPTPSGSPTPTPTPVSSPTPTPTPAVPQVDHVFLVILENHSFFQVIGSPSMPYLNSLASQHALATNYFADTHPSIGNYFMLTTGIVETNDDAFAGTVSDDNLVRAFAGSRKTWKGYMESLPSAGYTGPDVYPYFKHHDPFVYLTDLVGPPGPNPAEEANVVPFTQLPADVAAASVPNFSFIVPNAEHDAHDCPDGTTNCTDAEKLAAADTWLKTNIDPLITNPALANSVFVITFDEGEATDTAGGGGHVATVIVGAHVKAAFQGATVFQHESTLRLVLDLLRVSDHPGKSATAAEMTEFFQ